MLRIDPIDDPFSLDALAQRVRGSSNFRFNWQFYAAADADLTSRQDALRMLSLIIEDTKCHAFLRDSFPDVNDEAFSIEPLHEHCGLEPVKVRFDETLARAAFGHLGAYAPDQDHSTGDELKSIQETFGALGDYCAFQLIGGTVADCAVCARHNHHLFTNWFYGVAWDWCFLVTWPSRSVAWMGCLTDTD